jgi:hypothetical protein
MTIYETEDGGRDHTFNAGAYRDAGRLIGSLGATPAQRAELVKSRDGDAPIAMGEAMG